MTPFEDPLIIKVWIYRHPLPGLMLTGCWHMMSTISLLLLMVSCSLVSLSPLSKEQSVCSRTFCGAGRECVSNDRGEPTCRCLESCAGPEHWVCGSDSKSYRNHCELHREACVTHTHIRALHDGLCQDGVFAEGAANSDVSPMACFMADRDWLRNKVIQWIQEELDSDKVTSNALSAQDLLQTYFKTYDDGDSQLDSKEFLSFLKHNETALNMTDSNAGESSLLRSLCVDALIELSDENADWKLSLAEFINCLTASYQPPERECALEDEVFEDGAETHLECNKCVCACGNWVCTALSCSGGHQEKEGVMDKEDEEMTEDEWSRRVAELTHTVS